MLKQIAAGLSLAMLGASPVFAANEIVFDPDGAGALGNVTVGAFDWLPGSAVTVDVIPTQTGSFQTYSHATLGDATRNGGALNLSGLNADYEITFVAGFGEGINAVFNSPATAQGGDIYTFTQTISLGAPDAGFAEENFFEIYWDDSVDSDALGGTGFNNGTLIASGTVASVSGNFTTQFTFEDSNGNGTYEPEVDTIIGSGETTGGFALLDSNGNGDQWGGQETVTGIGSTSLRADLDFQDSAFFKSNITSLAFDLNFNTSNILPFQETDPSQSYWDGSSQVAIGSADVGEINGLDGPDIIFQADANNSFNSEVPEPKTVLLFALGLILLGVSTRRRQAPQLPA